MRFLWLLIFGCNVNSLGPSTISQYNNDQSFALLQPFTDSPSANVGVVSSQCSCLNLDNGEQVCVSFDFRFQAATLIQAIRNFPDLTGFPFPQDTELFSPYSDARLPACSDQDPVCQSCADMVINRLVATGAVSPAVAPEFRQAVGLPANGLTSSSNDGQNCQRLQEMQTWQNYWESKWDADKVPRRYAWFEGIEGMQSSAGILMIALNDSEEFQYLSDTNDTILDFAPESTRRAKRSAFQLGTWYKMSCTKRGEPVEVASKYTELCDLCWVWRKLPDGYFPQFLNELVCGGDVGILGGTQCIQGAGRCFTTYKNVDVYQSVSPGVYKRQTLPFAQSCTCQVDVGSDLVK